MKKLFGYLALGVVSILGLASCNNENTPSTSSTPAPSVPQSTAPAPSVPQSTAPAPSVPQSTAPAPSVPQSTAPAPSVPQSTTPAPSVPQSTTPATPVPTTPASTAAPTVPVVLEDTTVYLVGDSTVCSFNDTYYLPRYGYGTQIANYLDDKATIINYALSGRSSKSFLVEPQYELLESNLSEGDYLVIGFGHNDEKSDDSARFTDATKPLTDNTSFKYYLNEYYIELAKEKGATPILCTPVVRANKTNDYSGSSAHVTATGDYAEAIRELGEEVDVDVVDLTEITKTKYTELGYSEAQYYHAFTAGKYDTDGKTVIPDSTSIDTTHLNIYGAKYVAYSFAKALDETDNTLGNYVLDDIKEPIKANDLVPNSSYQVPSYKSPDLANYSPIDAYKTLTSDWYGTAFGNTGGNPSGKGFVAKETTRGVFSVGQSGSNSGKFSSSTDGFAFLFRQVDVSKNFTITVNAKVTTAAATNQSGFGLMLRDDCYINQGANSSVATNFVAAGFLTTSASEMTPLFSRTSPASLTKDSSSVISMYTAGSTATFTIERVGQSCTTTVVYNGQTYTHTYYDFDFQAMDYNYMYVGMYATRGTLVEFTDLVFTITGESQGA